MYLCTLFMCRLQSYIVFLLFACASMSAYAQGQPYTCELGLQGGVGYYVGDASPHIFMNPREAYGVHFRYKFTKRWAIQAKVSGQRICGHDYKYIQDVGPVRQETKWTNQMLNTDVVAEFNFFRFDAANKYDKRIRPYTPYLFLGIGVGFYGDMTTEDKMKITAAGYMPFGFGFKWKFAERWGLNVAWQHNVYFSDDIEGRKDLNNRFHMNGWNWMNCDLTGMMTAGIVFEFARAKKACRICNY